jgi:hypothetical protein
MRMVNNDFIMVEFHPSCTDKSFFERKTILNTPIVRWEQSADDPPEWRATFVVVPKNKSDEFSSEESSALWESLRLLSKVFAPFAVTPKTEHYVEVKKLKHSLTEMLVQITYPNVLFSGCDRTRGQPWTNEIGVFGGWAHHMDHRSDPRYGLGTEIQPQFMSRGRFTCAGLEFGGHHQNVP